ncbi:Uncharacterised protein [Salmonella enterica subsp. enterica serovar Typhimurium str. DT104]|nr:Uncharacterised protein [Salmonella enterica subsp. enterica serovar Bovismorbificans]CQB83067.1 Uncharacterised protein [Salmonella enterica subsp. enterica serovar Typhimurium str. DT104]CQC23296.1 Uncharacterised protein [Salmonella enterica subsp. enterica serovar Typhimurium str. DT104]CQC82374.1 Uncharacterised protein [Salmonella enterica subsp. enterica serovar Typhimurium str. DT104]CQD00453.1 Uncharacterised protein [Salmonella enterica subsp. enterica serovar Typhimurium str. DT10
MFAFTEWYAGGFNNSTDLFLDCIPHITVEIRCAAARGGITIRKSVFSLTKFIFLRGGRINSVHSLFLPDKQKQQPYVTDKAYQSHIQQQYRPTF